MQRPGIEPTICWSRVQCPNHYTTEPHLSHMLPLPSWHSDRYQIILLGNRGTCVNNLPRVVTWQWNDRESKSLTSWSQVRLCNHYITKPLHCTMVHFRTCAVFVIGNLALDGQLSWRIHRTAETTKRRLSWLVCVLMYIHTVHTSDIPVMKLI